MKTPDSNGGIWAAWLLIAAGMLGIVNNVLPGYTHLDIAVLYVTSGIAVLLGLVSLRLPWSSWNPRWALILVVPAFALIAISDAYGGVSPFSYAVYFIVVFVWVGIAQPPLTSLFLTPLLTLAYFAPLLRHRVPDLAGSATVAVPVCLLVGEVLARAMRQQERAQHELQLRVRAVERLATLTLEISRDLELTSVIGSIVDVAAEIFDGRAVFGLVEDSMVRAIASKGVDDSWIAEPRPIAKTNLARASETPGKVTVGGPDQTRLPIGPGGCALTVACWSGSQLFGGIAILLDRPAELVSDEVKDVARLIGSQAEVALLNAAKHRQLLDERQHEQAVFDVLQDGVIVIGADGLVCSCNNAAAALFGWDIAHTVGRELPIAVEVDELFENQIGPGLWIETRACRLPKTDEIVLSLRDVSRQHALDEAKDLFLATTSHELRTPLTAIKGYVATLQKHWVRLSDNDRRRALSVVDEQTNALIRLTDHLLLGAKAASSPSPRRVFDLGSVVRAAVAACGQISTKHFVHAEVVDSLPLAIGHPDSVRSALSQIIENAVKFSPGGGEVRVEAYATPDGRLSVDVLDRGIGLPAGREHTLFEPFVQGLDANTRPFGGVGLGLYIVRRLVEAQGGEVTAEPRPGGGTILRLWIPKAPLPLQRRRFKGANVSGV